LEPIKITLGGADYAVRPFNIEQHGKVRAAARRDAFEFGLALVTIALERAEPKPERIDAIECSAAELDAAAAILLRENGFPLPQA
jgi:hypothetical protein